MRERVFILVAALALSGCVTEVRTPRLGGTPVRPLGASGAGGVSAGGSRDAAASTGAAVELPSGPVARPVAGTVTNSRIVVSVQSLGTVPYDGQVLPIVSPDGRFLAVEWGSPPPWPALLAGPTAEPPTGTRLSVYDLTVRPTAEVARGRGGVDRPPGGTMLGRGADDRGFLVESIRPDGARWIGRVAWVSGGVEWLVADARVNAHAVFTPDGGLLFTRRPVTEENNELVYRASDGTESARALPGVSYSIPQAAASGDVVFAFARGTDGTAVEAIRLDAGDGERAARLGAVLARSVLSTGSEPGLAYQMAASMQGPMPWRKREGEEESGPERRSSQEGRDAERRATQERADAERRSTQAEFLPEPVGVAGEGLALFHPRLQRAAVFDPRSGVFLPLAARSFAAAAWSDGAEQGFFCATRDGLVFTPVGRDADAALESGRSRADARVLATAYVPRRTQNPERPMILLGPAGRDAERLEVAVMRVGGEGTAGER